MAFNANKIGITDGMVENLFGGQRLNEPASLILKFKFNKRYKFYKKK